MLNAAVGSPCHVAPHGSCCEGVGGLEPAAGARRYIPMMYGGRYIFMNVYINVLMGMYLCLC